MGARILVVDDDPWILRMVTATLEKKGYTIDTAKDGQRALDRALSSPPDVVICDVMMPVMDGLTFARQLRTHPHLASTPVIFLTALAKDEGKLRGLGLGPGDYMAKPFRFEELERRVQAALRGGGSKPVSATTPAPERAPAATPLPGRHRAVGPAGNPPAKPPPLPADRAAARASEHDAPVRAEPAAPRRTTALGGKLEQLGLASLLVMMEMERKDGLVTLREADSGEIGRVFLRAGQVVCARIDAHPKLPGRECVYALLTWKRGNFSFNAMEVDMEDTVQSSTTHLLMEGARLIDEANRDGS